MTDNRNTILAVILSGLVLIAWQYFFNVPQMEKQRAAQLAQSQTDEAARRTPAAHGRATDRRRAAPSANAPAANAPASLGRRRSAAKPPSPPRRASRSTPPAFPAASR